MKKILCIFVALLLAVGTCALVLGGCGSDSATTGSENGEQVLPHSNATTPDGTTTTPSNGTTPSDGDNKPSTTPTNTDYDDVDDAGDAALAYAKKQNPSLGELEIVEATVLGDWARVDVRPVDKSADVASVLLKKNAGSWEFVAIDSMLLPENYPDAPDVLFE